jgi:hypothetical protein
MSVYRFKVYFEDDENVYREIEIRASQHFEDLHKAIQRAINFDDLHPASFFMSNDTWRKGREVKLLRDKTNAGKNGWMHDSKIASFIEDPHQKIIYEFDPDGGNWVLFLELMKILPDSPITYPRVNKSVGNPPPQYKVTTPVQVAEDDDEEAEVIEEEDNYVKSLADHHEETDEEEVEHEIKAHAKPGPVSDDEEVVEEATEGAEGSEGGFEEEGGLEEEEL